MMKLYHGHPRLLAALLILCIGCKDEEAYVCYIKNISGSPFGTVSYEYDSDNRVNVTRQDLTTKSYSYDSNGNIVSITSDGSPSSVVYAYDSNNNLLYEDYGNVRNAYEYNSNNQLTARAYVSPPFDSANTFWRVDYEYPDATTKNPASAVFKMKYELRFTTFMGISNATYEYDDHPNPLIVLFPSLQTDNNVTGTVRTVVASLNGDTGKITTITNSYSYNKQGYPISCSSSLGETQTYSYVCK